MRRILKTTVILAIAVVFAMANGAAAQFNRTWNGGDANYNVPSNWLPNVVPEAAFDEVALISSEGVARVTDTPPDAGGLQLIAGTLIVESGGVFTTRIGDEGLAQGAVTISPGTLQVNDNGTANLQSLVTEPGVVRLGANADLNITDNAELLGTMEVTYDNGFSPISVGGDVEVRGSLVLNFVGAPPSVGSSFTVIDAGGTYSGNFDSITTNSDLPFEPGQLYAYAEGAVTLEQRLVVTFDMDTKQAILRNPGLEDIIIDGYGITSGQGSLAGSAFVGSGLGGLTPIGQPTNNGVAELDLTGTTTIPAGASIPIGGEIYRPAVVDFGVTPEDYVLEYTTAAGEILRGGIDLVGTPRPNNLTLVIDPDSGAAELRNTSFMTVEIEGYTVRSENGSLTDGTWTPQGGDWLPIGSNANQLGELLSDGILTLDVDEGFGLGVIADPADIMAEGSPGRDMRLEFFFGGSTEGTIGAVVYGDVRDAEVLILSGDFNGDGAVNAADYTVWRDNLGATEDGIILSGNGNGGTVDATDYQLWKSGFGNTSVGTASVSETAVPEPATSLLLLLGLVPTWRAACRH